MDPVPLDTDLVSRFEGKTMAIVGYETDQVHEQLSLELVTAKCQCLYYPLVI